MAVAVVVKYEIAREGMIKCNHQPLDPGERYFCYSQLVQNLVDKCIPKYLHSSPARYHCYRPGGL
jgi:hypothetical protein